MSSVESLRMLGENGLIKHIAAQFSEPLVEGVEGIGDDCAVIPWDGTRSMLVTTDTLTSGIHFLEAHISPRDLGYKSLAVNLSDIAAMGGIPRYAFLNLSIPRTLDFTWVKEFLDGLHGASKQFEVALLGGDTTATASGIFINLTMIGEIENTHIKRRSSAQVGDLIVVTRPLGDSAAGLKCILEKIECGSVENYLIKSHYKPVPEIQLGAYLGGLSEVTAMMDLSDGLNLDLTRLGQASKCKIRIDRERIPISSELAEFCSKSGFSPFDFSVLGGEDYALVFCIRPEGLSRVIKEVGIKFKRDIFQIGSILEGEGLELYHGGCRVEMKLDSFSHF